MATRKLLPSKAILLQYFAKSPAGQIVRVKELANLGLTPSSLMTSLSRLKQAGTIERVAKGQYRVPLLGRFGLVPPSQQQTLQLILNGSNPHQRAYQTGTSIFNKLGLTTQVPQTIELATAKPRRPRRIGGLSVRFIRSQGPQVLKKNEIKLRQLLDAIRQLKRIPDSQPKANLNRLRQMLRELTQPERQRLARLAQGYNPATRALVGALLEELGETGAVQRLAKSLNLLSTYQYGLSEDVLPNRKQWRIR